MSTNYEPNPISNVLKDLLGKRIKFTPQSISITNPNKNHM